MKNFKNFKNVEMFNSALSQCYGGGDPYATGVSDTYPRGDTWNDNDDDKDLSPGDTICSN